VDTSQPDTKQDRPHEQPLDRSAHGEDAYGTVAGDVDDRTVHFTRHYAAPIERVWAALTEPERLARWLTDSTVVPGPGGRIAHDFGDGGICAGDVLTWQPPHVLEYEWWFPQEGRTVLRFELAADPDGGTRLALDHRELPEGPARGYAAGWHAHLEAFAAELGERSRVDWDARFTELLPHYRR